MNYLKDKTAIITGASSGIGYATARLFAMHGANLVICARRKSELEKLSEEIRKLGQKAIIVDADISKEETAQLLVERAKEHFGGLDIAFNNAGTMGALGSTTDITIDAWQQTLATNLTSAFLSAKYQIPAMLESGGGSLIFTSTFVGYTAGMPQTAAYSASKSGLIGLTQALAVEYAAANIRVNSLLPGGVDTPMGRNFANTPETREFVNSLHAMKRIAEPEEIANSALYLASDLSSFTTGTAMLVDGGVSINRT